MVDMEKLAADPNGPLGITRRLELEAGFDQRFGTDTSAEPPHAKGWHLPIAVQAFEAAMQAANVRHEDYVFVDVGCGKGRALLLASERPFKRCIGVELDERLASIARKNVEIYSAASPTQKCKDVTVHCADAVTFDYPAEDLFLYLYNPFPEAPVTALVERLARSVEGTPRRIVIVYSVHEHDAAVRRSGVFDRWGAQGDDIRRWGEGAPATMAPLPMKDGKYPFAVYSTATTAK